MLGYVGEPDWVKSETARDVAIKYCLAEMRFYEDWGRHNRRYWKTWQNITIFLGSLATILAAIPTESLSAIFPMAHSSMDFWVGLMRAVPAAATTIGATVLGVYNYKGEHLRQGVTHDALQGELAKFLSKASPYTQKSDDENASKFTSNIRSIISSELQSWLKQFADKEQPQQCQGKDERNGAAPETNPSQSPRS